MIHQYDLSIMKTPVQFTIDAELLARIDRDPDVKRYGRSAFLRRAAEEFLRRKAARRIRDEYRRGYRTPPFPDQLGPWPPEDVEWPDE
jgi:hypothetical protein